MKERILLFIVSIYMLIKCMKNIEWRKTFPFVPIVGLILTPIYHRKYGDTGIQIQSIMIISTLWQTIIIYGIIMLIAF